jgi:hypothetical protein
VVGFGGVTAIEESVATVTVSAVEPVTPDAAAEIVVVPIARAVANPCEPAAFEMLATEVFEDVQVTDVVKFCVELSE